MFKQRGDPENNGSLCQKSEPQQYITNSPFVLAQNLVKNTNFYTAPASVACIN